jgi:hypothetical protein
MNPAVIVAGIETAGKLVEAISKMAPGAPELPSGLQGKDHWLMMTVYNQTQYPLVFLASYFNSGRFYTAPTNVPPFKDMTFSGCASDGSLLTGVSGGVQFQIGVPGNPLTFGIGFSNPQIGAYKASVVAGDGATAEQAYDKIDNTTITATFPAFSGTDVNGNPVKVSFQLVSSPGQEASVTVTEQVLGSA